MNVFLVCIGGALGALCRYGVSRLVPQGSLSAFPWATLVVNLLGCLLLGMVYETISKNADWLKPLLIIGFLGGFTTFSSFGLETFQLLKANKMMHAFTYISVSTIGGLVCVVLGNGLAKMITNS